MGEKDKEPRGSAVQREPMTLVFGMTAGRIQEVDVVRVSKRMGKEGTVSESYVRPARPTEKKDRKPKI